MRAWLIFCNWVGLVASVSCSSLSSCGVVFYQHTTGDVVLTTLITPTQEGKDFLALGSQGGRVPL